MTVKNLIEHSYRALRNVALVNIAVHTGHEALLQAIYARCYPFNRSWENS